MPGNAAIPYHLRELVGDSLMHVASELEHPEAVPQDQRIPLYELGVRIRGAGPTLVSLADVDELFDLVRSISSLRVSGVLDHQWGRIKRMPKKAYVFSFPGGQSYSGVFHNYEPIDAAERMYLAHLHMRGLIPVLEL